MNSITVSFILNWNVSDISIVISAQPQRKKLLQTFWVMKEISELHDSLSSQLNSKGPEIARVMYAPSLGNGGAKELGCGVWPQLIHTYRWVVVSSFSTFSNVCIPWRINTTSRISTASNYANCSLWMFSPVWKVNKHWGWGMSTQIFQFPGWHSDYFDSRGQKPWDSPPSSGLNKVLSSLFLGLRMNFSSTVRPTVIFLPARWNSPCTSSATWVQSSPWCASPWP